MSGERRRRPICVRASAELLFALTLACAPPHVSAAEDLVRRGEYVFRAAGCTSCHTDRKGKGEFLAGGRPLQTPFGTFYSPNITPDLEHGIGRWSDEDFVRALADGVSPNGAHYYPAFPYTSYTRMRRADMLALKAYLFTVAPVARPNRKPELAWYARWRSLLSVWKWLFFTPGELEADPAQAEDWNRGAYLAKALAHCGECHTPRNLFGAPDEARRYAGTPNGPEGEAVPNITPDRKTGIGRWREDDIVYYLETGATPGGDYAGSLMADVIDDSLSHLTQADLQAIVSYLRSLPAIEHAIKRKKPAKRDPFD